MNAQTDQQLLGDYAGSHSEPAFAELVRRHINLVYSAALRMVRDAHLAEDVTQGAFVTLAQNARQLTQHPVLSGWLHRMTQNLAANAVRTNVRRQTREQEAVVMNELLSAEPDANWEHIAPHLDAALGELSEPDRDALLLRYFERKSAHEMAETLGISDEAAQKRVSRAVERLREFFAKRGVTVGVGGLVVVLTANAVQAAPVSLAVTITTVALAGATIATTTTIATVTKAIAMTTLQKTLVTTTVAVLAGAGIYEARQASSLRTQVRLLQQQQTPLARQVEQLQHSLGEMTNRLDLLTSENEQLKGNTSELLRLRAKISELRLRETGNKQQNEQKIAALTLPQTNALHFSYSFLTKATCRNVGLDTVENALQTYLWALNGGDEQVLAELATKNDKGKPKKLEGLSLDYEQKLIGVQPLDATVETVKGAKPPRSAEDVSIIRFALLAEVMTDTNAGLKPSQLPLTLRFKKEGGLWKFDGNR